MTRFLSEILQAPEPFFRLGLRKLEAANGHPSTDIRFSTEVMHASQAKLRQLGLDPHDTTAEELYHALQERVQADDARLTKKLRTLAATHISAEGEVVAGMVHALQELPDTKRCFALKGSAVKTLIKKLPPKKAMRELGYRSLDSFVKHESPITMLAAAWLSENSSWQHRWLDQYKRLKPSDFENRSIALVQPNTKRWRELADSVVARERHNLLSFKELGAVVFLPLPATVPNGTTLVSTSLALHELNEIRAASTFLKLCQVRPDFGKIVQTVVSEEPNVKADLLDQPVPWRLIQRHYARLTHEALSQAFEPHVQLEDMIWHPLEQSLSAIESSLSFWHGSEHVGLLQGGRPVSFNLLDAALNYCNKLPFEQRLTHYFQQSLWHELLLRYLKHDAVEQAVTLQLQPQLAEEALVI
ncbi:MAG TPA: hypothetical protein VN778_02430 [Verrucomicrobiae bacterium]|nr:hypothetical protein [Verrucomicrobiae bacterium]